MTHDELLAHLTGEEPVYTRELLYDALRAVVELHKPDSHGSCIGCDDRCSCMEGDWGDANTWETCPTIQAIEKELA